VTAVAFAVAEITIALLGLPAAFHPTFRRASIAARCGAAFLLGALLLTLEGIVWSLIGVPWTAWTLGLPLAGASLLATAILARRQFETDDEPEDGEKAAPVRITAKVVTFCALAFLAWQLAATRATSPDLLYFWGVKGVRFAASGGIDATLLAHPHFIHLHVTYPPLLPTSFAWGYLAANGMPWLWVPAVSWIWIAAAAAALGPILRPRVGGAGAAVVTAVWTTAVSASMVASSSGGNAEPPLVAYLTVACAALVVVSPGGSSWTWSLVALGFAGAVLSKNEGPISVGLLIAGALVRAWLQRDRRSAARLAWAALVAAGAVGLWKLYLALNGLALTDPVRQRALSITFDYTGEILSAMPKGLAAGTAGLSWLVLLAAIVSSRRLPRFLPAATLGFGLLFFAFVYYLHAKSDPTVLIGWTLPRLSQPALSAMVLWAGLAWLAPATVGRPGEEKSIRPGAGNRFE
jgi:hypothetical protein